MVKFDSRNYRKHNQKNKDLIRKSLEECGTGRSIVIDNEDEIIAGNGVYEQAKALNIPLKIIETDGSELVVVKRTDLQTSDDVRKKLAVMDNSTSDTSEFDLELLSFDFDSFDLEEMGIDIPDDKGDKQKDISNDLKEIHEVVVECDSEIDQEQVFSKLTEMGLKCRLLTL